MPETDAPEVVPDDELAEQPPADPAIEGTEGAGVDA